MSRDYYDKEAKAYKSTDPAWVEVVAFGGLAKAKAKNLVKGQRVSVQGELTSSTKEIGGKKYSFMKVTAKQIDVLATHEKSDGSDSSDASEAA